MLIHVRLFAILKDRAGLSETTLELPAGATAADASEALAGKFPSLRGPLQRSALAVNRSYCAPSTPLNDGDELALIPPVSGG
jgi:molybdopterin converting factor subunit 1